MKDGSPKKVLKYKMAKIKRFVLNLIAFIFAIFLSLKFLGSLFFVYAFGKLPLKACENLREINCGLCAKSKQNDMKNYKNSSNDKQNQHLVLQNLFQQIVDSCISLCLTATLVNYNGFLVKFTFIICHNVHHSFLSLIFSEIPDFTKEIQNSYSYFLVWGFILCGFFGITTQIAFIMDLINILTLPTKLIYTVLRWIYSKSVRLIRKLYEFIRTEETKWITCPYPKKFITAHYRTLALMLLIILVQVTAVTVFYYYWLCLVILGLVFVENSLHNFQQVLGLLGQWLCLLKKYQTFNEHKSLKNILNPIFDPETAVKIIKGTNVFENKNDQELQNVEKQTKFSFLAVINCFSKLGQGN